MTRSSIKTDRERWVVVGVLGGVLGAVAMMTVAGAGVMLGAVIAVWAAPRLHRAPAQQSTSMAP